MDNKRIKIQLMDLTFKLTFLFKYILRVNLVNYFALNMVDKIELIIIFFIFHLYNSFQWDILFSMD